MNAAILSFPPSTKADKAFLRYLVVQIAWSADSDDRFCLSPDVMHWQHDIWLIDLQSTQNFWLAQAQQQNLSLSESYQQVLQKFSLSYTAIQVAHPWQALVLLAQLKESPRIYHFHEAFCQNHFRNLSWSEWLSQSDSLHSIYDQLSYPLLGKDFSRRKKQLLRAMQIMGFENLCDFPDTEISAIQKRFGYAIAKLWEWSFPDKAQSLPLLQLAQELNEFPWIAATPKVEVIQERHLDYSLDRWEEIQLFLAEDFLLLYQKHIHNPYQCLCELQWQVQLYSGECFRLAIYFRNPYPIANEFPHFSTALQQCEFQFNAWQSKLRSDPFCNDYPEASKIVAWKIQITKSLYTSASQLSLSGEHDDFASELELLQIENKLARPFQRLASPHNFQCPIGLDPTTDSANSSSENHSLWQSAGYLRPLFLSAQIQTVARLPYRREFLERSDASWWCSENNGDSSFDFFKTYEQQQWRWLVRRSSGDIYEIGRFD